MPVRKIPRHKWTEFCRSLKRRHRRRLSTVRVVDEKANAETVAENMALQDIIVSVKNGREDNVKIVLGESPERGVVHTITEPFQMRFEHTAEGAPTGLSIEEASGATTVLQFHAVLPPHYQLDGIILN